MGEGEIPSQTTIPHRRHQSLALCISLCCTHTPIPTSHQPPGFSSSLHWTNSLFTALMNLRSPFSTPGRSHIATRIYTLCCCVLTFPPYINSKTKVYLGAETCALRKSTSFFLLAITAFDRIAVLHNRHLNSNRGYVSVTILKSGWGPWLILPKESA